MTTIDAYQIIIINGASSSGKSTLARAFQEMAPCPFLCLSFETFYSFMPLGCYTDLSLVRKELIPGFHRSAAAFGSNGSRLILEHVLLEEAWFDDCRKILTPFRLLWVGLNCRLEVLESRERLRADRLPGLARSQIYRIHSHPALQYDMILQTDSISPQEGARSILSRMQPSIPCP
ncbi:MAG: hypothetical protein JW795_03875 [Chitinivibrionales bacterium]|nr:hypothetical protein [Chitinivibrionales bacterium]